MILSDSALTKISSNFILTNQPRHKRSISRDKSPLAVKSLIRTSEERDQIDILQRVSQCLFELYESKLD